MADFYLLTVIQILTIIFSIWNYDRSYECKYVHYIQPTKFRGFFEWKTSTVDWLITVRKLDVFAYRSVSTGWRVWEIDGIFRISYIRQSIDAKQLDVRLSFKLIKSLASYQGMSEFNSFYSCQNHFSELNFKANLTGTRSAQRHVRRFFKSSHLPDHFSIQVCRVC